MVIATNITTISRVYEETSNGEKIFIQLLATVGSIQSGSSLMAILTSPKIRRKITFVYVINLLLAQLLLSTITVPMYCFAPHHFLYPYVTALTIVAYTLNLCTVTYERYLAICRPYRYSERVSYSKAVKVSIVCWIVAAVIQILPVFWEGHSDGATIQRVYLGVTLVIFFIAPLIMIWMVYGYITYEIYRLGKASYTVKHVVVKIEPNDTTPLQSPLALHKRKRSYFASLSNKINISKPKQEFQLAAVFIAAAVASNITWVPVIMMVFLQVINRTDLEPRNLSKIHIYLLAINGNVDPLIYGMFLKQLRERIVEITVKSVYPRLRNVWRRKRNDTGKSVVNYTEDDEHEDEDDEKRNKCLANVV